MSKGSLKLRRPLSTYHQVTAEELKLSQTRQWRQGHANFIRSVASVLASIFPHLNTRNGTDLCCSVDFNLVDSSAWRRSSFVKIEQEVWIPPWFQPGSWLHFVVSESSFMRMINAQFSLHWSYVQQRNLKVTSAYSYRPEVWIIILFLTLLCLPTFNAHFRNANLMSCNLIFFRASFFLHCCLLRSGSLSVRGPTFFID